MKTSKAEAQSWTVEQSSDAAYEAAPAGDEIEARASSSCGDGKGRVAEAVRPLRLQCGDCEQLLHQLSNVITPILVHAQMLEWKLPPYSHLKRTVRELERNSRRAGELVKALVRLSGDVDGGPSPAAVDTADSCSEAAFPAERRQAHKQM